MKSILVKLRVRTFKDIAFIFSLCVFLVACGGQDSVDPNTGDAKGPEILLNLKGDEAVVKAKSGEVHYILVENITYQTADTLHYVDDNDNVFQIEGAIIGYRQEHAIGSVFVDPGVEAKDLYSGVLSQDNIITTGTLDIYDPSDQEITYTATDGNGNQSSLKRFFILVDETPPTIKFNGDRDIVLAKGNTFVDSGAEGIDNLANNIDTSKNKITIKIANEDKFDIVEAISTDEVAHFQIEYSFTDKSGNEGTSIRNVFVRNTFNDSQPVFQNGAVDPTWVNGIMAYDQGIPGYGSCTNGNGCPNIKWVKTADSSEGKGNVLQVSQLDNDFDSGLFISSTNGIDLRGSEETGLLQLDIKRVSGSDPYVDI